MVKKGCRKVRLLMVFSNREFCKLKFLCPVDWCGWYSCRPLLLQQNMDKVSLNESKCMIWAGNKRSYLPLLWLLNCFEKYSLLCGWNRSTAEKLSIMLWLKLVIVLVSEANCFLRCGFPRLYRPSCRVKGDELNYWSGTSPPTFTCSLAHAKWTCSALCRDHDQASTSQCCWNFDMAFSSPGCDEQNSRSADQLKDTIIPFQSLQTSFRSFPNTQESHTLLLYVCTTTN